MLGHLRKQIRRSKMNEVTTSIYIACLASYNNGILHGKWVEVEDYDQVWDAIKEVLKSSPIENAEEWAIHDYEGFGKIAISEYDSIERICNISKLLQEYGEIASEIYDNYQDTDQVKEALEDKYVGEFETLQDYAQDIIQELYNVPEHLLFYLDYDKFIRDMEMSGDIDTYYLNGKYHIFYTN
jgi:antirestriction protein